MPEGGRPTIATTNARLDESYADTCLAVRPGLYVAITVTDDGHAMSPEMRARAFEPFFTTEEFGKGSGLGLSMVSGFVKQSNGHVSIYNEPGLGTTVRLYLRAAVESAPQRPAPSARAQGAARFRLCHRNARRTRTRTAGDAAAEHAAPESRLGPARARGARRVAAAG